MRVAALYTWDASAAPSWDFGRYADSASAASAGGIITASATTPYSPIIFDA
jgi:hypothetical protein